MIHHGVQEENNFILFHKQLSSYSVEADLGSRTDQKPKTSTKQSEPQFSHSNTEVASLHRLTYQYLDRLNIYNETMASISNISRDRRNNYVWRKRKLATDIESNKYLLCSMSRFNRRKSKIAEVMNFL